jgi:hypothetical protein
MELLPGSRRPTHPVRARRNTARDVGFQSGIRSHDAGFQSGIRCICHAYRVIQPEEQKQVTPEATVRATSSAGPNIFVHMMEQSDRIIAQKQTLK